MSGSGKSKFEGIAIKAGRYLIVCLFVVSCSENADYRADEWLQLAERSIEGATFKDGRIFIRVETENQDSISFFTDTGGGKIVYPEAVERLKLTVKEVSEGTQNYQIPDLNTWLTTKGLPTAEGDFFLYDGDREGSDFDGGMLGAHWFGNKCWHFDYHNKKLSIVDSLDWSLFSKEHKLPVGFMKDSLGNHLTHFPRIPITVEGDTIEMLYDSGASIFLSDSAKMTIGDKNAIGGSFIVSTVFDRWKIDHPDWHIIEGGDRLIDEDLILVPTVQIANHQVGPVWFARRADHNFTEFMSQWMDEPIQGAIGGSCFQYFNSIVLDYRQELAYFDMK